MFASQDAGTRGSADGVGAKAVFKEKPFIGNAVDRWGRSELVQDASGVSRDCLTGMVIGKEKEDVGAFGSEEIAGCRQ